MTKEELEKEAREYANNLVFVFETDIVQRIVRERVRLALIDVLEPREKQIQIDAEQIRALQKQNGELNDKVRKLEQQIEKMKKYIKACWVEENLNDYSSYITNSSDEFRDLVKELNDEVRNGR